jgi:chromate transporter
MFRCFLRFGATAYSGPPMLAYVQQECLGRRRWLSDQEFKEGMALCQVIPGASVMPVSTYIGYRCAAC